MKLQAAFLREVSGWFASRIGKLFERPRLLVGVSVVICAAPIALSFMFEPASIWTGPPSIWTKIVFGVVFLYYADDALDGDRHRRNLQACTDLCVSVGPSMVRQSARSRELLPPGSSFSP